MNRFWTNYKLEIHAKYLKCKTFCTQFCLNRLAFLNLSSAVWIAKILLNGTQNAPLALFNDCAATERKIPAPTPRTS